MDWILEGFPPNNHNLVSSKRRFQTLLSEEDWEAEYLRSGAEPCSSLLGGGVVCRLEQVSEMVRLSAVIKYAIMSRLKNDVNI